MFLCFISTCNDHLIVFTFSICTFSRLNQLTDEDSVIMFYITHFTVCSLHLALCPAKVTTHPLMKMTHLSLLLEMVIPHQSIIGMLVIVADQHGSSVELFG